MTEEEEEEIIPKNVTIRQEYVKCGKIDCETRHGPYYYAYWKENGKLKKKYIGKDYVDGNIRLRMKDMGEIDADITYRTIKKCEFIQEQVEKGNKLAPEYEKKLKDRKVSIDWAYKQIKENIGAIRLLKMLQI